MPPEFGEKWETECLYNRLPLPTLAACGIQLKSEKKKKIENILRIYPFLFMDIFLL